MTSQIPDDTQQPLTKASPILVVGAGTWGLSTAWHLARSGYTNVVCIDKFAYPSPDSAGYDLNKMARTEYAGDMVMQRVSHEALNEWRSNSIFEHVFHETGRLSIASSPENYAELREYHQELLTTPFADRVRWFDSSEDIKAFAPYITGEFPQGKAVFNPEGGWVHAREAMRAVGQAASVLGVRFIHGDSGTAKQLIYDDNRNPKRVLGVRCVDGTEHVAERVVLATGAWSDTLIDMEGQLVAKCWTLAHVQVSDPAECAVLKDIPVIMDVEKGFFFEPDETGKVKICNEFPGFTNYTHVTVDGVRKHLSVPRGHGSHPSDTMPTRSFEEVRALLRLLRPEWADRELFDAKICWCTDTPDRHFLIAPHPNYGGSLILATGDSGHGFKMLPTVGRYVVDLVEGAEGERWEEDLRQAWRWRPETAGDRPGDDSRPGVGGDLKDQKEWKGEEWQNEKIVGEYEQNISRSYVPTALWETEGMGSSEDERAWKVFAGVVLVALAISVAFRILKK